MLRSASADDRPGSKRMSGGEVKDEELIVDDRRHLRAVEQCAAGADTG